MKYPDIDVSGWRRIWEESGKSTAWAYPVPSPPARRPWLFWLALAAYLGLMSVGFWICWRAFAGWPIGTSLLMRLAG